MRVLIVSAFLAYAAAAPSGIIAPLVYHTAIIPAAVPTISSGDIQAAAINTQVQINDLARAAADKAQEAADQAIANVNDKVIVDDDQAKERSLEAFWSNEEKKWQALDAIKTAEAQIDGVAASNADVYAKSAYNGAYVAVAPVAPVAPVVAPIHPVVYSPYVAAVKSVATQTLEVKAEENKENKEEKTEAVVKTAEPEKPAESEEGKKAEAEKPAEANKPIVFTGSLVSPIANLYRYDVALPALSHYVAQPVINYAYQPYPTSYHQINEVVAPTLVKHVW